MVNQMKGEILKIETAIKLKKLEMTVDDLTKRIIKAKNKLAKPIMTDEEKELYGILEGNHD